MLSSNAAGVSSAGAVHGSSPAPTRHRRCSDSIGSWGSRGACRGSSVAEALSLPRSVNAATATDTEEHDKRKQRNQEQQRVNGNTACEGDREQYDNKSYEHFLQPPSWRERRFTQTT
jgi:hypothetical protein